MGCLPWILTTWTCRAMPLTFWTRVARAAEPEVTCTAVPSTKPGVTGVGDGTCDEAAELLRTMLGGVCNAN